MVSAGKNSSKAPIWAISALKLELEIANDGRFFWLFLGMTNAAFIIHDHFFSAAHFSHHAPVWLLGLVNA
jgi:hypothetical protein